MGHAGMAATAVRHLRSVGAETSAPSIPGPVPPDGPAAAVRPVLRAVREDERTPGDRDGFRRVLGHFASGVTVVTAPGDAAGPAPAGFACQSFASLSLDPPLATFMVARTPTTWPRIARAGACCVNILGAGRSELCRGLAVSGADKCAGVRHTSAPVRITAAGGRTSLARLHRPGRPHGR